MEAEAISRSAVREQGNRPVRVPVVRMRMRGLHQQQILQAATPVPEYVSWFVSPSPCASAIGPERSEGGTYQSFILLRGQSTPAVPSPSDPTIRSKAQGARNRCSRNKQQYVYVCVGNVCIRWRVERGTRCAVENNDRSDGIESTTKIQGE
jgi:hypothetical protein